MSIEYMPDGSSPPMCNRHRGTLLEILYVSRDDDVLLRCTHDGYVYHATPRRYRDGDIIYGWDVVRYQATGDRWVTETQKCQNCGSNVGVWRFTIYPKIYSGALTEWLLCEECRDLVGEMNFKKLADRDKARR